VPAPLQSLLREGGVVEEASRLPENLWENSTVFVAQNMLD
jgi:hypothetical protein